MSYLWSQEQNISSEVNEINNAAVIVENLTGKIRTLHTRIF